MGRRKIPIEVITNEKSRLVTFAKRKNGLFKKAYELSILCGCEVAVLVFTPSNRLYQYSTDDMDHAIRRRAQHSKANSFLTNKDMKKMAKSSTNDIAETNFESNSDEDGVTGLTLDDEPFDAYEQGECIMMNTSDSVLSTSFGAKQTVSQNSINFTAQYHSSDRTKRKRSNNKKRQISSTRNGITVKNGVYSDDCANVKPTTVTSGSTISDNLCTYSSFADPYVLQCSSATSSTMTLAPCQLLYYTDSVDQSKALIPIAVPCVPSQLASTIVVPSVNVVGPTSSYAAQDKDSNNRVTDGKFSSVTQPPINRPLYTSAVDNHDNQQNLSSTPMDLTNRYQSASKKPNTSRGVSTSMELSVLASRNSVQTIAPTLSNSTTSMYTPSRWRSRFPDNLKLEIQPYALNNIEPTGLTADIRSVDFLPTPEITRFICGIEAKDNDGTNSSVQTPTTDAKDKNLEKLP